MTTLSDLVSFSVVIHLGASRDSRGAFVSGRHERRGLKTLDEVKAAVRELEAMSTTYKKNAMVYAKDNAGMGHFCLLTEDGGLRVTE